VTNDPSSSATTTTTTATILLSVRDIAQMANLPTCTKPDSMGICFIGQFNFTKFISQYLPLTTTTIW
jgi:tRNA-specific 2-thiouridylase